MSKTTNMLSLRAPSDLQVLQGTFRTNDREPARFSDSVTVPSWLQHLKQFVFRRRWSLQQWQLHTTVNNIERWNLFHASQLKIVIISSLTSKVLWTTKVYTSLFLKVGRNFSPFCSWYTSFFFSFLSFFNFFFQNISRRDLLFYHHQYPLIHNTIHFLAKLLLGGSSSSDSSHDPAWKTDDLRGRLWHQSLRV